MSVLITLLLRTVLPVAGVNYLHFADGKTEAVLMLQSGMYGSWRCPDNPTQRL